MKMAYLGGCDRWPTLDVQDLMKLGFLDPEQSAQVLSPIHQRIVNNWELLSKYGTVTRGPNVLFLSSSSSFTPLDTRKPTETIYWYNNLAQLLESFNVALTPFEHIEMKYGAHALCPPGLGIPKLTTNNEVATYARQLRQL
jgi:hypothetical protein